MLVVGAGLGDLDGSGLGLRLGKAGRTPHTLDQLPHPVLSQEQPVPSFPSPPPRTPNASTSRGLPEATPEGPTLVAQDLGTAELTGWLPPAHSHHPVTLTKSLLLFPAPGLVLAHPPMLVRPAGVGTLPAWPSVDGDHGVSGVQRGTSHPQVARGRQIQELLQSLVGAAWDCPAVLPRGCSLETDLNTELLGRFCRRGTWKPPGLHVVQIGKLRL